MILLGAVLVSFVVALVFGGSPTRLAKIDLKCAWLGLVSVTLQLIMVYADLPARWGALDLHLALVLVGYVPLIAMVLVNRHLPGMWLLSAGMAINLTAMLSNRGWMPISPETLARAGLSHLAQPSEWGTIVAGSKDAVIPHAQANLWFLGDVFVIPGLRAAFSIGDVILATGAFWFFWRTMRSDQESVVIRS